MFKFFEKKHKPQPIDTAELNRAIKTLNVIAGGALRSHAWIDATEARALLEVLEQ